ncbi:hypothetical protein BSKO_07329 [Bryopsis sp. KO-2023]|nr:hypothetical protein BSKO_07329 [Bryopsis sp. KO-2023]
MSIFLLAWIFAIGGSVFTLLVATRRTPSGVRKKTDDGEENASDPADPAPRKDYLSWDDYFMAVAFLGSKRSKDPHKQVGACIACPENVILGMGYNGFPRGCSDYKLPWAKIGETSLDTKYPYVVHAEANAILNTNSAAMVGSRIYVTLFPCNECTKLIIQAGIKEVVYFEDKLEDSKKSISRPKQESYKASRRMLSMAGIMCRKHCPKKTVVLKL